MSKHTPCQMVIEILQKTKDGRLLYQSRAEINRHGRNGDGQWLKFLENAANGFLNEHGLGLLEYFHRLVMDNGEYRRPFDVIAEEYSKAVIAKAEGRETP